MVYSYKVLTARTCLKYLSYRRQRPIIFTHAWPSCHFDLSTYNNLTLPRLGLFLGHLPMPLEVHIVCTDISAVSLTATASSALEVCEPNMLLDSGLFPRLYTHLKLDTCRRGGGPNLIFERRVLHLRLSTSGTWQDNLTSCTCQVVLSPSPLAPLQITWQVTVCQVNLSSQLAWWPTSNNTRKLSQEPPQRGTRGGVRSRSSPKKESKSFTF